MKHFLYALFIAGWFSLVLAACDAPNVGERMDELRRLNNAIMSLEIVREPDKMAYELGEKEYSLHGLEVYGVRSNGEKVPISTDKLFLDDFDSTTMGIITTWVRHPEGPMGAPVRARLRLSIVRPGGLEGKYSLKNYIAPDYAINGAAREPGWVSANMTKANEGMEVGVIVAAAKGFQLKAGTLSYYTKEDEKLPVSKNDQGLYSFTMPAANVFLYAEFELLAFDVSVDFSVKRGLLSLSNGRTGENGERIKALAGDPITVNPVGTSGYELKAGTLVYQFFDASLGRMSGPRIDSGPELPDISTAPPYTFPMPPGATVVTAEFSSAMVSHIGIVHPPRLEYEIGAKALDFEGFTFFIEFLDKSRNYLRCHTGQWWASADGTNWEAFSGLPPSDENFTGFEGQSPFDATRAVAQLLTFSTAGKTATSYGSTPLMVTLKLSNSTGAALAAAKRDNRPTFFERYYRTLEEAIAASPTSGYSKDDPDIITLLKDTVVNPAEAETNAVMSIVYGQHIELRAEGGTVKRGANAKGPLFDVASDASFALNGRITVDGGASWGGSLLSNSSLNSGVSASDALVRVSGGAFTMKGAGVTLQNNDYIPIVPEDGYMNMNDCSGGGVKVQSGSFTMEGGKIAANRVKGSGFGGGIYVHSGTVIMQDGLIEGNYAFLGGAAYTNAVIQMRGGLVKGNNGVFYASNGLQLSGSAVIHESNPLRLDSGSLTIAGTLTPPPMANNANETVSVSAYIQLDGSSVTAEGVFVAGSYLPRLAETAAGLIAANKQYIRLKRPSKPIGIDEGVWETLCRDFFDYPFASKESGSLFSASGGEVHLVPTVPGKWDEVHTFTGNATLILQDTLYADILVVAGGGAGGGGDNTTGGGGAGGLIYKTDVLLSPASYPITVGLGGGPGLGTGDGGGGGNSQFAGIVPAIGGGGGAKHSSDTSAAGRGGGSGGGGSANREGGAGTPGQGHNGGAGGGNQASKGGGGGGAGGPGITNGNGGAGRSIDITGKAVTYAKGGNKRGNGGGAGTDGLGNGGEGGPKSQGCMGGSGVVIVRLKQP